MCPYASVVKFPVAKNKAVTKVMFVFACTAILLSLSCSRQISGITSPIQVNGGKLDSSLTTDNMIGAFYQGKAGNCASVSVIKAAILTYAPEDVFKSCDSLGDGYKVTLRDDAVINITGNDLEKLRAKDKFVPGADAKIYNKARFLYALIAKRKLDLDSVNKYQKDVLKAADALNGAEDLGSRNIFPLLGLGDPVNIEAGKMADCDNLIITNKYHSAFSGKGYYDEYGRKVLVSDFKFNHKSRWPWNSSSISDTYCVERKP